MLTHLHGDHVGSLFQVLCQRSILGLETPIIVPSEAFAKTITQLLDLQLYERKQDIFIEFGDIPTIGITINKSIVTAPSMRGFAYYFSEDNELIYYSGDIGRIETAVDFLNTRNESNIRVFHDALHIEYPSHTHYKVVNEKTQRPRNLSLPLQPRKDSKRQYYATGLFSTRVKLVSVV